MITQLTQDHSQQIVNLINSKDKKNKRLFITSYILKNVWKKNNYFEGQHYFRTKADVYLRNKKKAEAHIYYLQIPKV